MSNRRIRWTVALMIAATLLAPVAATAGSSPGEVVDRFFAAYGERSLEGMLATYAADVVFEDVNQRHRFEGTDQVTRLLGSLVAMHYEMGTVEKRRVVQGPTVVVEYDYVGKLNGTVLGQAVGKEGCPDLEYVLPVTSWYEVKDGKITHQRDFIDWATHQELRQRLLAAGAGE